MPVSFGGLASGLDTTSIVRQLVDIERGSVRRLENKRRNTEFEVNSFSKLTTKLEKLRTTLDDMSDISSFGKLSVESSDEDVLTATSNGQATPGQFSVEVRSLASAQKTLSDNFASSDGAGLFGEGTLSVTVGDDAAVDITVDATTTLNDLKNSINDSGADVFASIVNTDLGYRLVVNGKSTGTSEAVTFGETGTLNLGLNDPVNTIQSAQDAQITIDGVLDITRSTNSITDAIQGVTLDLKDADIGNPVNIDIQRDSSAQAETLTNFIDAYNDVVSFIDSNTRASTIGQRGPLLNNPTMLGVKRSLRSALQSIVPTGSNFTSATTIGIESTQNGKLELNTAALESALSKDFDGTLAIFTTDNAGLAALFDDAIDNMIDVDGLIPSQKTNLDRRVRDLNDQIIRQNKRVDSYEDRLQAQFLAMEQAISQLNNQSSFLQSQLLGF